MSNSSIAVSLAAALVLAGCVQSPQPAPSAAVPSSPVEANTLRTGSPEDERACMEAVAKETKNSVAVLSSEFSEANTVVMVGVGPERARWRCLVSKGRVAEVTSTVDEGAL